MKFDEIIETCRKLAQPYCIAEGDKFRLDDIDPDDTRAGGGDKPTPRGFAIGVQALPVAGSSTRGSLGRAPHLPGYGRAGKDGAISL